MLALFLKSRFIAQSNRINFLLITYKFCSDTNLQFFIKNLTSESLPSTHPEHGTRNKYDARCESGFSPMNSCSGDDESLTRNAAVKLKDTCDAGSVKCEVRRETSSIWMSRLCFFSSFALGGVL